MAEKSASPRETVFDVDIERLAKVYGQAVLDAAGASQDSVMEELRSIVDEVLDIFPDIEGVFATALVNQEEKLEILDRIFGGRISDTTLSFLKILTKHDRLGFLRQVVSSAEKLWSERNGRVPVELQFAQEPDGALQQQVIASLGSALGFEPVVNITINPDLIAGFVAKVGDKVYDASAQSRLERSRHAMVEHAVEAIQNQPERFIQKS